MVVDVATRQKLTSRAAATVYGLDLLTEVHDSEYEETRPVPEVLLQEGSDAELDLAPAHRHPMTTRVNNAFEYHAGN